MPRPNALRSPGDGQIPTRPAAAERDDRADDRSDDLRSRPST
ncbi:hypothetical protein [Azospirillum lipoferum]|nr:hypothetical protein [Azospirillum lipoferum]